jgi:hypothetical protein
MGSLLLAQDWPPGVDPLGGVPAITRWFGALQGQDAGSLLWSLGVRLPGTTITMLRQALETREVVRTWPMRGTLHLVPARDARWMVQLMAGRSLTAAASRHRQLGIEPHDLDVAVDVLGSALAGGRRLSRAQCVAELAKAGLPVEGQGGYHLLGAACRRGVTCMVPEEDRQQMFMLLDDWAPDQAAPDRDQALGSMVVRYLRSHGPATRKDFAGWTGMTLTDTDRAIAVAADQVSAVEVDGQPMLAHGPSLDAVIGQGATDDAGAGRRGRTTRRMLALPGFDEFLLGFKDRELVLRPEDFPAVVPGGNGMFLSTVVRAGQVVGTWRRIVTRGRLTVTVVALTRLGTADRTALERALRGYAHYQDLPLADVTWS